METVEELCRQFSRWGLTRADVVVAVGGGVVTDTAGFAAAVYHRGVAVVHVSTSLLGQVDAAIGGKTGVNLPEGKNLVGAFWQPAAVLCDTEVLETLPPREYRSGLGEMAKYHFLGGEGLEDLAARRGGGRVRRHQGRRRGGRRASEGGRRAVPQLRPHAGPRPGDGRPLRPAPRRGGGHRAGVRGRAGPARLERIGADRVEEHRKVVLGYGLPDRLPPDADLDALIALMGRDKKAVDGLTFVLDGPGASSRSPASIPGRFAWRSRPCG